jgi:hypothetical protein
MIFKNKYTIIILKGLSNLISPFDSLEASTLKEFFPISAC